MRAPAEDRGETLVEILVAVTIMGIASAAFLGGLMMNVQGSDIHAKQAKAQAAVRNYAEAVQSYGFRGCAADYGPSAVSAVIPTTLTASYTPTCLGSASSGPASLTLVVQSADGRAREQLVVVLRDSCLTLPC